MEPIGKYLDDFARQYGLVAAIILVLSVVVLRLIYIRLESKVTTSVTESIRQQNSVALESFKAEIKATSDARLETLRHTLAIEAQQRAVMFSGLYQRRADVIAELHAELTELYPAVVAFGLHQTADQWANVADQTVKIFDLVQKNAIWLTEAIVDKVMFFIHSVAADSIDNGISPPQPKIGPEESRQAAASVFATLEEIRRTFRSLLGEIEPS